MSDLTERVERAERHAHSMMFRALIASHQDLGWLLEEFDRLAEEEIAHKLHSRRSDEDVEALQFAIDIQRDLIRQAA